MIKLVKRSVKINKSK